MDKKEYQKVTITLPKQLLKEYKEFLDSVGMNLSTRLAILIENDLKKLRGLKKGLRNGL